MLRLHLTRLMNQIQIQIQIQIQFEFEFEFEFEFDFELNTDFTWQSNAGEQSTAISTGECQASEL